MSSPKKAKAGVTIFFSFFFFSFLFVLLFLFFSFCFFSFKKIFEIGQGGVLPFFSSGTALILGGNSEFSEMIRESFGSTLRVLWEFADA